MDEFTGHLLMKDVLQEPDFQEDEFIYDDLNLEEEEELYGIVADEPGTIESKWNKDCIHVWY